MTDDLVEEAVVLDGRELLVVRPRNSEALLDEAAFEHEEYLPYWAEAWPSGAALARAVAGRALHGEPVVELGCGGLALPSLAAALAGGRALATDWSSDGVAFAARNAERNGIEIETAVAAWQRPEALVARAPWRLVLGADLLYERRNVGLLLELLPRLVGERGEAWIADPGRGQEAAFLEGVAERFDVRSTRDAQAPAVRVHRLAPR